MKLYTGQGDDGRTRLLDGTRVGKDDPRVECYGAIDELNAHLGLAAGLARSRAKRPAIGVLEERLVRIQAELFSIGAELATPPGCEASGKIDPLSPEPAARLEAWIDEAAEAPPPLKSFILPGGDALAGRLHVCRTVCRRAERRLAALAARDRVNPNVGVYLNRLGDLLFAWARLANHAAGIADTPWRNPTG